MNYRRNESSVFFRRALDNRNVRGLYPNGFLPLFGSNIIDYSATVGSKGETSFGMSWDLSHTVGGNYIHYVEFGTQSHCYLCLIAQNSTCLTVFAFVGPTLKICILKKHRY